MVRTAPAGRHAAEGQWVDGEQERTAPAGRHAAEEQWICGERRRGAGCTRRALLGALVSIQLRPGAGKGRRFDSDRKPVVDPATEVALLRLTDPGYTSQLPASHLRALARTRGFLLYSSDRGGSLQVFRLELASGRQQQLTQAGDPDPFSPGLLPDDRNFCYWDGPSLRRVSLRNLRDREVYRVAEGWRRGESYALATDGSYAALIEVRGEVYRLRVVRISSGKAATLLEGQRPLGVPRLRSRREGVLFEEGLDALRVVGLDGRNNRQLPLPLGSLGRYIWAPDGKSIFYLQGAGGEGTPNVMREHRLDSGTDRLVAKTSGFTTFSANADASVLVGASGRLAGPYILLLLCSTGRELALCEHGASDAAQVHPVFSPDSRRVYFQTDREGHWAIYCVPVDRLVEPTPT